MDLETLKEVIDKGFSYFPIIALFYMLDKTNSYVDLCILLFAFIFTLGPTNLVKKRISLSKDRIPFNVITNRKILFIVMLIEILVFGYSLIRLISLFNLNTAKFLIIIGIIPFFRKVRRYIINLESHLKKKGVLVLE